MEEYKKTENWWKIKAEFLYLDSGEFGLDTVPIPSQVSAPGYLLLGLVQPSRLLLLGLLAVVFQGSEDRILDSVRAASQGLELLHHDVGVLGQVRRLRRGVLGMQVLRLRLNGCNFVFVFG